MRRIIATAVVGVLMLATAASASAARITLRMSTTFDPRVKELTARDGALAYGWYGDVPIQVFEALLVADDGKPVVDMCLKDGARLEILNASLKILHGASCTNAQGVWQFVLSGANRVRTPTSLTAQLLTPATTVDGRTVSPAASNAIVTTIAPRIVLTSSTRSSATRLPIIGAVRIPAAHRTGTVLLQRQTGATWATMGRRTTDARGRFTFTVSRGVSGTHTTYRLRYQPKSASLWAPSGYRFTITWVPQAPQ